MARIRPVDFEDRLTLIEHLDELRSRIIVSLIAFAVAFGLCIWQNSLLLDIANDPIPAGALPAGQEHPEHLRRRRALHHHAHGRGLRGVADLAAGAALPALRLHPAGAEPAREAGDPALPVHGAVPVPRRRRVRLLRRRSRRR